MRDYGPSMDEATETGEPRLVHELRQMAERTGVLTDTVSQLEKRLQHVTWNEHKLAAKNELDGPRPGVGGSETTARLIGCREQVDDNIHRLRQLLETLDV